jgi:hypothetical protein
MMLGCNIVFLEMNPAGYLSSHVVESKKPSQSGVVGAQVEFLSMEVVLEVCKSVHSSQ